MHDAGGQSKVKKLIMPEGYADTEVQLYTLTRVGQKDAKICNVLASIANSTSTHYGTLGVVEGVVGDVTFEDALRGVEELSQLQFESYMAKCDLAVYNKKSCPMQEVVKHLEPRLRRHMEAVWKSSSCLFKALVQFEYTFVFYIL